MKRVSLLILTIIVTTAFGVGAEAIAKITRIEGKASVLKKGGVDWRDAKPLMLLEAGDQLYTREESFAEIRYAIGTVLRMDEKTKITLETSSEKTLKTRSAVGDVWINMKKLLSRGNEFDVSTPTAVAAIRGTVFRMKGNPDSSSEVDVYNGRVAVGPSDELRERLHPGKPLRPMEKPVEVPGPEEIPGPFEVPLDQWRDIVAGQKIEIRPDGKFKQEKFNMAAAEKFVKINEELDKELTGEK